LRFKAPAWKIVSWIDVPDVFTAKKEPDVFTAKKEPDWFTAKKEVAAEAPTAEEDDLF